MDMDLEKSIDFGKSVVDLTEEDSDTSDADGSIGSMDDEVEAEVLAAVEETVDVVIQQAGLSPEKEVTFEPNNSSCTTHVDNNNSGSSSLSRAGWRLTVDTMVDDDGMIELNEDDDEFASPVPSSDEGPMTTAGVESMDESPESPISNEEQMRRPAKSVPTIPLIDSSSSSSSPAALRIVEDGSSSGSDQLPNPDTTSAAPDIIVLPTIDLSTDEVRARRVARFRDWKAERDSLVPGGTLLTKDTSLVVLQADLAKARAEATKLKFRNEKLCQVLNRALPPASNVFHSELSLEEIDQRVKQYEGYLRNKSDVASLFESVTSMQVYCEKLENENRSLRAQGIDFTSNSSVPSDAATQMHMLEEKLQDLQAIFTVSTDRERELRNNLAFYTELDRILTSFTSGQQCGSNWQGCLGMSLGFQPPCPQPGFQAPCSQPGFHPPGPLPGFQPPCPPGFQLSCPPGFQPTCPQPPGFQPPYPQPLIPKGLSYLYAQDQPDDNALRESLTLMLSNYNSTKQEATELRIKLNQVQKTQNKTAIELDFQQLKVLDKTITSLWKDLIKLCSQVDPKILNTAETDLVTKASDGFSLNFAVKKVSQIKARFGELCRKTLDAVDTIYKNSKTSMERYERELRAAAQMLADLETLVRQKDAQLTQFEKALESVNDPQ